MVISHVPSTDQYSCRVDGRKTPLRRRMRWRQRHRCPITTTSSAATTRERGRSRVERARSPCPPRAPCGKHLRSFAANHGRPNPLLTALSCPSHVVPKLSTTDASGGPWLGDDLGRGTESAGSPAARDTRSGTVRRCGRDNQSMIISTLYLPETTANVRHRHVPSRDIYGDQTNRSVMIGTVR
jgi:hypothetical protein